MTRARELARKSKRSLKQAAQARATTAVVVSVQSGTVTLNLNGDDVDAPGVKYLAHCAGDLTAGDVVALLWNGSKPTVIGRYP